MQQVVELIKLPGGNLRVQWVGNEDDKEDIRSLEGDYTRQVSEIFEHYLCNGWDWIPPEAIGALTAGEIISDDTCQGDYGNFTYVGKAYWHRSYETVCLVEALLNEGYVIFEGIGGES